MVEIEATIQTTPFNGIKCQGVGDTIEKAKEDLINNLNTFAENGDVERENIERFILRVLLPKQPFKVNPDAPCKNCESGNEKPCETCPDNAQFHCEICGQLITKDQERLSMLWYNQSLCKQCEKKPRQH